MHPDMIGNMLFTLLVMMCLCGAIILGVAVKPCALTLAVLLFSVAPEIFPYWDDFAKIDYHRASAAEGTVARLKMKYVNSQFQFYPDADERGLDAPPLAVRLRRHLPHLPQGGRREVALSA